MSDRKPARADNDTDTGVAARIRDAREALDWTPEELARRLGVTVDTVEGWENGDRDPRSNRLVTLAGVLQVSAHWLLDGSDQFAPSENSDPGEAARAQLGSIRLKIKELERLLDDMEYQLNSL